MSELSVTSPWVQNYLSPYHWLSDGPGIPESLVMMCKAIVGKQRNGGKMLLAGNGASASIASHLAADFSKQANIRAQTFNEPNLITALGNDFGYESWIAKAVELYADPSDCVVLISSSGASPNIIKAAEYANQRGLLLLTLSGFAEDNPLRKLGEVNLWVNSRSYNIVECVHMIWLTAVLDAILGKAEYPVG